MTHFFEHFQIKGKFLSEIAKNNPLRTLIRCQHQSVAKKSAANINPLLKIRCQHQSVARNPLPTLIHY